MNDTKSRDNFFFNFFEFTGKLQKEVQTWTVSNEIAQKKLFFPFLSSFGLLNATNTDMIVGDVRYHICVRRVIWRKESIYFNTV